MYLRVGEVGGGFVIKGESPDNVLLSARSWRSSELAEQWDGYLFLMKERQKIRGLAQRWHGISVEFSCLFPPAQSILVLDFLFRFSGIQCYVRCDILYAV